MTATDTTVDLALVVERLRHHPRVYDLIEAIVKNKSGKGCHDSKTGHPAKCGVSVNNLTASKFAGLGKTAGKRKVPVAKANLNVKVKPGQGSLKPQDAGQKAPLTAQQTRNRNMSAQAKAAAKKAAKKAAPPAPQAQQKAAPPQKQPAGKPDARTQAMAQALGGLAGQKVPKQAPQKQQPQAKGSATAANKPAAPQKPVVGKAFAELPGAQQQPKQQPQSPKQPQPKQQSPQLQQSQAALTAHAENHTKILAQTKHAETKYRAAKAAQEQAEALHAQATEAHARNKEQARRSAERAASPDATPQEKAQAERDALYHQVSAGIAQKAEGTVRAATQAKMKATSAALAVAKQAAASQQKMDELTVRHKAAGGQLSGAWFTPTGQKQQAQEAVVPNRSGTGCHDSATGHGAKCPPRQGDKAVDDTVDDLQDVLSSDKTTGSKLLQLLKELVNALAQQRAERKKAEREATTERRETAEGVVKNKRGPGCHDSETGHPAKCPGDSEVKGVGTSLSSVEQANPKRAQVVRAIKAELEKRAASKDSGDDGSDDKFEKMPASRGPMMQAIRDGKGKDAKIVLRNGKSAPDHIKPAMVPPDWANVRVSLDPGADLLVQGTDNKGRPKSVYSDSFHSRNAAIKLARVDEMMQKSAEIDAEIQKARTDPKTREAADCAWLMAVQATRPGSEADTGGKVKAYGATTLEGRHVTVDEGGTVRLSFVGKEGVLHNHVIRDLELAAMLVSRSDRAGVNGKLFDTNAAKVNKFVGELDGGHFSAKDFRTRRANQLAVTAMKKYNGAPKSEKEYKERVKVVAEYVSGVLGNRPQQALESYINPAVFASWRIV